MKVLSPYVHLATINQEMVILDAYNGCIYKVPFDNIEKFLSLIKTPEDIPEDHVLISNKIIVEDDYYMSREDMYTEFRDKKDYLHLVILPTENCNFRCQYCYEEHRTLTMSESMMDAVVQYVSDNIKMYKALRIEWFGGEPLYAKNVVFRLSEKFIDICKQAKKPYYASMTTNGYYLDAETFRTLFKYKVSKFQITLDGLENYHDEQRFLEDGSGTFNKIVSNLKEIRDTIKSSLFNITIRSNITAKNKDQFGDFLDYIKTEFAGDPRFNFLWKIAWNPDSDYCDTYLSQNTLRSILSQSAQRKLNLSTSREQMRKFGNICYACNKNSFIIGPDGTVYKCTVALDQEENKVGQLLPNGEMILDQKKYNFWTERKQDKLQTICEKCFLYPACLGIYCNLNNMTKEGKFVCSGYKQFVDDYLACIVESDINIIKLDI